MTRPDQTTARFGIDLSCSGIHGLITFVVLSIFLAYLVRDKPWKKIALVLTGLPLIYVLNILRISTLLAVGYNYGEDIAQTLFHSISGLAFTFIGALILILVAQKLLKTNFSKTQTPQGCLNCSSSQDVKSSFCQSCGKHLKNTGLKLMKRDVAKIGVVAAIIVLLLLVQAPISALVKAPTNLLDQLRLEQEPSTRILPLVSNCSLQFEYRDTDFEQQTGQDGTLTYSYTSADPSQDKMWIVLEIADGTSSLHDWAYCLITWPLNQGEEASVTQLNLKDVQIMQNPPIIARVFAFRWNNYNNAQVVVYWRETLAFTSNNETQQKNVQVSLSIYPNQPEQITQTEDTLQKLAESIAAYWEPLRTWTPVALLLSKNANILAASSTAALALVIPLEVLKKRYKTAGRKAVYSKIADEDKRILAALGRLQRKNLSTPSNLKPAFQKLNNLDIDEQTLENRLQDLSKIGLAYPTIRNVEDDPVLVWKTGIF
jgi:exosortase/archaeosortase family protein